jgi:hypothetical protein
LGWVANVSNELYIPPFHIPSDRVTMYGGMEQRNESENGSSESKSRFVCRK